jgi:lysophospholipase L1-like esterase
MRKSFIAIGLICIAHLTLFAQTNISSMQGKEFTMLALGDSYTIGEGVGEADRFPNQLITLLDNEGIHFQKPKIIATTGWTSDELLHAISNEKMQQAFDFVTLLIGVNNQYRGLDLDNYREEFKTLLQQAINLASGNRNHVIVISIPDWGVTKFAEGRDRKKIASEIDEFNAVNQQESEKNHVHYINITGFTREHPDWLTSDGLHPDLKQYALWADQLSKVIHQEIISSH